MIQPTCSNLDKYLEFNYFIFTSKKNGRLKIPIYSLYNNVRLHCRVHYKIQIEKEVNIFK